MTGTSASGAPNPLKAFLLTFVAPGYGHRYAGDRRRAGLVAIVTLSLLMAGLALALLPPVNLPVLIVMALPLLALLLVLLWAAVDAALTARHARDAEAPLATATPAMLVAGIVIWVAEVAGFAAVLVLLSGVGVISVQNDHMAPTLLQGDRVVTWRDYYRDRLPERGDIAVVLLPGVDGPRVMRIVGLPGDSLLGVLGALTVNGRAIERERLDDFGWRDAAGEHRTAWSWRETLPGGTSYEILQSAEGMLGGTFLGASLRIPDGSYFVIGDNRNETQNSWDFGFLPGEVLSDRPTVIIGSTIRSRIGHSVQP